MYHYERMDFAHLEVFCLGLKAQQNAENPTNRPREPMGPPIIGYGRLYPSGLMNYTSPEQR